jgi:hypothetical protein
VFGSGIEIHKKEKAHHLISSIKISKSLVDKLVVEPI